MRFEAEKNKANLLAFSVQRSADSVKIEEKVFEKTNPILEGGK